jgi:ribosomal protein S18 acetylase RimI-like enzyme
VPFCTLLYIDEKLRGQGLGRALVRRWEADMRALGHGMAMTSTQSDEDARHFWRALGYRNTGSFDIDVPGYAQPPELIMLKDLRVER